MSKTKKTMSLVLSFVLVIALTIAGTIAYLTSTSTTVTNTFTVGKVKITLDEAKVTEDGVQDGNERVTENTYKLIPGHEYLKDPIVHVDAESEDCYLVVKIVNELGDKATITMSSGWTNVEGTDFWVYGEVVSASDNVPVFTKFLYAANITDPSGDAGKTIKVTAYAIQADGFSNAKAAYEAAFGAMS